MLFNLRHAYQHLELFISKIMLLKWLIFGLLFGFLHSLYAFLVGPILKGLLAHQSHVIAFGTQEVQLSAKHLIVAMLSVILLKNLCFYFQKKTLIQINCAWMRQIEKKLKHWILGQSLETIELHQNQLLHQGLLQEIDHRLERLFQLPRDLIQILFLLLVALWIYPQLFLILCVIYPFFIFPLKKLSQGLKQRIKDLYQQQTQQQQALYELLIYFPLIKGFALEERLEAQDNESTQSIVMAHRVKVAQLEALLPSLNELSMGLLISLYLLYDHQKQAGIALDQILSFLLCLIMLYQPIKGITQSYIELGKLTLLLDNLMTLLQIPSHQKWDEAFFKRMDSTDTIANFPSLTINQLVIQRAHKPLYQGLNLSFEQGQFYLIFGANAIGKSSLFAVLLGLLPIEKGEITLRYHKDKMKDLDWKQCFSIAFQQGMLGNQWTQEQLFDMSKAEALGLLPLLQGINLQELSQNSGGQIKRLDLVRALIQDRYFYLLDEPEAFLDQQSLSFLIDYLGKSQLRNKCIIVISHQSASHLWSSLQPNLIDLSNACQGIEC